MVRCGFVALLVVLLLSSCRGGPEPEQVAANFYELCEIARQEGFAVVQQELYDLLSAGSRGKLEECAIGLTAAAGEGAGFTPVDCLVFDSYAGKRGDFSVERVAAGKERVRLVVSSGGLDRVLEMVKEDGWRIDLEATVELNGALSGGIDEKSVPPG